MHKPDRFILPFFLLLLLSFTGLQAQNEVIVTPILVPPYSPFLTDYAESATINLQNTTNQSLEVKLTGHLEGDSGYILFTKPNYLPPFAIELGPFESRTIFASTEAGGFLDLNNMENNVPDNVQRNIYATGQLPEGNYSFCIEAREYLGDRLLSAPAPAGCIPINISYVDPPILINPLCEAIVENELPILSWSPPIGNIAGAFFTYDLYVVPLSENETPNEAIDRAYSYNAGNPIIIRDIMEPLYVWQAFDLPLEAGRTYAVQVVARDISERIVFSNQGRSPVCTFTMASREENVIEISDGGLNGSIANYFPKAKVSGQLLYRFPGPVRSNYSLPPINSPFQLAQEAPVLQDMTQPVGNQPLNYDQAIYFDPFPVNPSGALPLANTRVKLIQTYVYKLPHLPGEEPEYQVVNFSNFSGFYDNDGPNYDGNGKVISVTTTDENGNYEFDFIHIDSLIDIGVYNGNGIGYHISNAQYHDSPTSNPDIEIDVINYTGFYRVFRLEVDNNTYCSPDISIMIQPNQELDLPQQVALVRSYNLEIETAADNSPNQISTAGEALQGIEVEVLRNVDDINTYKIPEDEGQNLGLVDYHYAYTYNIISKGETNADGKILFNRLVKHPVSNNFKGRYKIRANSKEINTAFAYKDKYIYFPYGTGHENSGDPMTTPFVHGNGIYPMAPEDMYYGVPIYNSQYEEPTFYAKMVMTPDMPVVSGRVRHDILGLPDVLVFLIKDNVTLEGTTTDEDGYFRFDDVEPGSNYKLALYKSGYQNLNYPPQPFGLQMGTFKDFQEIQMQPLGEVSGYVENEQGAPLNADVRVEDSPWYPTNMVVDVLSWINNQPANSPLRVAAENQYSYGLDDVSYISQLSYFNFPAESGNNLKLIIDPRSDQYFRDTFYVDIPISQGNAHYLGTFQLKEKLHRPKFIVQDEDGKDIIGAKITIQEKEKFTGRSGIASFVFASPGTEFIVRIDPPEGSNLVPFQQSMLIPISPDPISFPITLQKGGSIFGLVTAGPDSLPLANARVFLDEYWVYEYDLPVIEAFTDQNGMYELQGLPKEFVQNIIGETFPLPLTIKAVKTDPQITYIGDEKQVALPRRHSLDFHLEMLDGIDLSQIWGFSVEIEEVNFSDANTAELNGAFVNLPANGNFKLLIPNTRLDFANLIVDFVPGPNGELIADPVQTEINLDVLTLPIGIMDNFQGQLKSSNTNNQSLNPSPSTLTMQEESQGQGILKGRVYMELSSFEFSYQYNGHLYLGDDPNTPVVSVFRPETVPYPRRDFSLMALYAKSGYSPKDPYYSVHEFGATADRFQSYLREDTVALYTVLHTNIQLADPSDLQIEAGYIRITHTDILSFDQGDFLSFDLESWKIESTAGWYYDKNNGGIHIPTATIKTGVTDVPIKDMILYYDDIKTGELSLDDPDQPFMLGGIAELELLGGETWFYLDQSGPTDLNPHWRIELLGNTHNPAARTDIPEFDSGQIYFESFSLLSNGDEYANLDEQTVWLYDVLEYDLHSIVTGAGFFQLTGEADLHIPDVPSSAAILTFTKPNSQIQMDIDHLEMGLDGTGKVEFIDYNFTGAQSFSTGLFTAKGQIRAYDDQGNAILLEGHLKRTPSTCLIEVIQVNNTNQHIVCGGVGSNTLEVIQGVMPANLSAFTWDRFEFDAIPRSSKGLPNDTKVLHFVVNGDIEASGAEISVSEIGTPFGGLEITFNLEDMSMSAYLNMTTPMTIGVATVHEAEVNFYMAEKGFYFLLGANADISFITNLDLFILAGHYAEFNQDMQNYFIERTYQTTIPEAFQNGFSGFLLNAKWQPIDAHAGFDVLEIVYLDLYASAGLEVRVLADFADDKYAMSVLGFGEFMLAFGGPCFDTGIGIMIEILLAASITDGDFLIEGCASVGVLGYYQACVPTPLGCVDLCASDCWTGSVRVDLAIGEPVGGFDFSVDIGGPSCSGNPMTLSDYPEALGIDCD